MSDTTVLSSTTAPFVSVIIVNYNGGDLLTRCVLSALSSQQVEFEIFVVDNASDDTSLATLRTAVGTDKRVQILQNTQNEGFAKASNRPLPQTHGQYLLFLNPDCIIQPNTLHRFCQTLDTHPEAGMAGALVRNPDGTEQAGSRRGTPSPWRSVVRVLHLDKFFPNNPRFKSFVLTQEAMPTTAVPMEGISGACMFVRRQAMEQVGTMDEAYFLHCEDLDWFMRFRQAGWIILFVPTIEVLHIKGACSRRHPIRVLWYKHRGMVRYYRKFFRQQYPIWLQWGVIIAVWTRFAMLLVINSVLRKQ
ncbi:glycosyltransferase family 2 protein [Beggiatoa leptomitoformis]|uniref:Glycosyltransferase n=1 Tax=Beggiatoa leptomitoformis TaxID=288004 RepID=A0A2N9YHN7_9GAMM|nr:glycosyltransferase family 2 protein [Beggiatoa leptomitoformis]ALG67714.1 glycosyltransferase [Beggiatoa leptomitoformis]AUI70048.1 glycosyltransferase [Beggiatoa leptomitoformis]